MKRQHNLESFTNSLESSILIPVRIELSQNSITLYYDLSPLPYGLTSKKVEHKPKRKDELWKGNCFELFLSKNHNHEYIEYNISPSGDWNCYEFDSYRKGMREKDTPPPTIKIKNSLVEISITIGDEIYNAYQITCIIEQDEQLKYFSTSHPKSAPDFHNQDCFIKINKLS